MNEGRALAALCGDARYPSALPWPADSTAGLLSFSPPAYDARGRRRADAGAPGALTADAAVLMRLSDDDERWLCRRWRRPDADGDGAAGWEPLGVDPRDAGQSAACVARFTELVGSAPDADRVMLTLGPHRANGNGRGMPCWTLASVRVDGGDV